MEATWEELIKQGLADTVFQKMATVETISVAISFAASINKHTISMVSFVKASSSKLYGSASIMYGDDWACQFYGWAWL